MAAISGIVRDSAGAPVAGRVVRAYRRDTGVLLGASMTSDGTPAPYDPHWANVVALLHLDGDSASTTFTDTSGKSWTAPGAGKLNAISPHFGTAALDATESTGGYIRTASSADFNFGTGDFTIEMWWSPTQGFAAARYPTLFSRGYTTSGGILVQASTPTSGAFTLYLSGVAVCTETSGVAASSGYHFYRFKRSGTYVTIERDGVTTATGTSSVNIASSVDFQLGGTTGGGGYAARGLIDDVRIAKGVARVGGVPSGEFPSAGYAPPLALGEYAIDTGSYTGEVNVICLDDAAGTLENDLIHRAFPV